jgi:hypothetical protein
LYRIVRESGQRTFADAFTDGLGRLTDPEQKLAKTTAFNLQMNPPARDAVPSTVQVEGRELVVGSHRQ